MKSDVYNIDCMEYMQGIPDKAIDLVIADPPYGIGASKPAKKQRVRQNAKVFAQPVRNVKGRLGLWDWEGCINE